jgi:hypothetical protein
VKCIFTVKDCSIRDSLKLIRDHHLIFHQGVCLQGILLFIHFRQSSGGAVMLHSAARLVKRWPLLKLDNDFYDNFILGFGRDEH